MIKMKAIRILLVCLTVFLTGALLTAAAGAEPADESSVVVEVQDGAVGAKAIAAAIAVGIAAAAGALGMGIAIAKSAESMARQPEAADRINSAMMLGLVFIETAIIYSLIVAILIIFVL